MPEGTRTLAYRIRGELVLETTEPTAEPVLLELLPGVEKLPSGLGQPLLYSADRAYGKTVGEALLAGWCRLVDAPKSAAVEGCKESAAVSRE